MLFRFLHNARFLGVLQVKVVQLGQGFSMLCEGLVVGTYRTKCPHKEGNVCDAKSYRVK